MLNEKKVVLVTGASRGIGQAIAKRFAKEGYAVVMHYHTGRLQAEQTAAGTAGPGCLCFAAAGRYPGQSAGAVHGRNDSKTMGKCGHSCQ